MPTEISITDGDIALAENILFSNGEKFDEERIAFIKNLDTIDLQAVPGSGKTTALMAKLLILERYLPFDDGSGILVISHTNAAIDEIKDKIGKYCPKLFSAPNFVGTIQKFTNEFLAIPFYSNTYNKRTHYIDDEIYNTYAKEFSSKFFRGFTGVEQNNAKRYLRVNDLYRKFRYSHLNGAIELTNGYNGPPLDFRKPRGNTRAQNYQDWTNPEKQRVKLWLFEFKKSLFREGVLSFDDAYCLAFEYLFKLPRIKHILQKRFQYVFVDEMQDMEMHQHDLLESIFFDDANTISKYQRIGDKNQSIYSREITLDEIWSERETLTINGSHRLTPPIAELVDCFALYRDAGFQVRGMREGDIPPHLIVYENASIGNVIRKYSEIINGLLAEGRIPSSDNKFKAIAWVKSHPDDDKIGLSDYFSDFDFINHSPHIEYSCLGNYLNAGSKTNNSLAPIQANVINALLKVLRLENIQTEDGQKYTKNSLFAYLKEYHELSFSELRLNLFQWSMAIAQGKDVADLIRAYVPNFLAFFGGAINHSNEFITKVAQNNNDGNDVEETLKINTVNYHGFDIDVTTVHAEKGKTHTATLYLETFYSRGQGNYESERLRNQFLYLNLNPNTIDVVKRSAKMMYVGISRPTHLLCVAVHKARFDEHLSEIDTRKWVIETP